VNQLGMYREGGIVWGLRPVVGHYKEKPTRLWFSPTFLWTCYSEGTGYTWQRDGNKVTMTSKKDGSTRVWILTDRYQRDGHRLGIWPD